MKELFVLAPVTGPTGYEEIARGLIQELYLAGVNISLEKFTGWSRYRVHLDDKSEEILKICNENVSILNKASPILSICLPEQMIIQYPNMNILYTMFEASDIPPYWVNVIKQIDKIFVPCKHSQNIFSQYLNCKDVVQILPCGFDPYLYHQETRPFFDCFSTSCDLGKFKHRILVVGENTERKNITACVEVFFKAFSIDDEVCMVIKATNYSRKSSCSNQDIFNMRKEIENTYNKKCPPIFIYNQIVTDSVMASFMAIGTIYLSMSRGEGYDLSALKMIALKKPVVVPKHTSYPDYVTDNEGIMISCKEVPCKVSGTLKRVYSGLNWYEPDIEMAVWWLKKVILDYDQFYKEKTMNIYSFENIADYVIKNDLFWNMEERNEKV